jgi:uncharacterized protein with GYD domain
LLERSAGAGIGQDNIRTTTLRAFKAEEMRGVISKVG